MSMAGRGPSMFRRGRLTADDWLSSAILECHDAWLRPHEACARSYLADCRRAIPCHPLEVGRGYERTDEQVEQNGGWGQLLIGEVRAGDGNGDGRVTRRATECERRTVTLRGSAEQMAGGDSENGEHGHCDDCPIADQRNHCRPNLNQHGNEGDENQNGAGLSQRVGGP